MAHGNARMTAAFVFYNMGIDIARKTLRIYEYFSKRGNMIKSHFSFRRYESINDNISRFLFIVSSIIVFLLRAGMEPRPYRETCVNKL
jgi:hypothetical protein